MNASRIFMTDEPYIVAEIAQNHDGSLGMCHAYIDALADVGVHAIKFQTHIASEESTRDEKFRVKFSYQDQSRYDYWRRMEFTETQWAGLKEHADQRGINFLSTPFSVAAVNLLQRIGVSAWKIGSGDTLSADMFDPIVASDKPTIVSTGMSSWREMDSVVEFFNAHNLDFALMQCTSKYPTPLTDVGLNVLEEMRQRYKCRIGLSDHSGSLSPVMVALSRGFNLIEVHATFDKRMFGPDVPASLTVEEIGSLVRFAKEVHVLDSNPVNKDEMASNLYSQKMLFGRSVALRVDRPAGHVLQDDDFVAKKPAGGIPWAERGLLLGKILHQAVSSDRLLKLEDLV